MLVNALVTAQDCVLFKHEEQCQTDTLKNNLNMKQYSAERLNHTLTSSALHGSLYYLSLIVSHLEKFRVDNFAFLCMKSTIVVVKNETILNV